MADQSKLFVQATKKIEKTLKGLNNTKTTNAKVQQLIDIKKRLLELRLKKLSAIREVIINDTLYKDACRQAEIKPDDLDVNVELLRKEYNEDLHYFINL